MFNSYYNGELVETRLTLYVTKELAKVYDLVIAQKNLIFDLQCRVERLEMSLTNRSFEESLKKK